MKKTFQVRITAYDDMSRGAGDAALAAYANLYARVLHILFARVTAGGDEPGEPQLDFVQIQRASVRITDRLHQALQIDPRDFYQLGVGR